MSHARIAIIADRLVVGRTSRTLHVGVDRRPAPDDLKGLPHRYNGEVQAKHEARVDGDRLSSVGTWRGLDIDGNETGRGPVYATATRFGVEPF